ncbi:lysozyme [Pedobacter sp. ok626]|uniref:lysozyme n=1 Tax=Pedobacter sp. ok626 TaxID=1761882 RepID=UPI00087F0DA8|nr:lysozyme [Pedobacter sp. ok626]SDJ96505.1 lysozyme [Pedobacter sp. ok626]
MNINKTGRDFIYKEEGVLLTAYKCQADIPTIGVGFTYYPNTGRKVQMGDKITQVECDLIFKEIIKVYEEAVNRSIKVVLTQNQFNALVSLAFNIGCGAFAGSTLVKKINAKVGLDEIEKWLCIWKNAGGKPILLSRRQREFKLYTTV